jgi:hypothetical protein
MQKELVDFKRLLPETEAARVLGGELEGLLEEQRVHARNLERAHTPETQESFNRTVQRTHLIVSCTQPMRIPLEQRIIRFFAPTI